MVVYYKSNLLFGKFSTISRERTVNFSTKINVLGLKPKYPYKG